MYLSIYIYLYTYHMYIYIRQISGIALGTKVLPYMRSTFLIQKMLSHGYR